MERNSQVLPEDMQGLSVEEFFNCLMETISLRLQKEGLEYDNDGNLVECHTPYSLGIDTSEN